MPKPEHSTLSSVIAAKTVSKSTVYRIQPLADSRWTEFLQRRPNASVFHSAEWLTALRRTYGYEPSVLTTSPPGADLQNGLVLCRVGSWLTGTRLVCVPFSDHCEPLVDETSDQSALFSALEQQLRQERLSYVELRPKQTLEGTPSLFHSTYAYCLHELDLRPDLDTLFRNCHKSSTQRKIRRAAREGLTYQDGRSEAFLNLFFRLFLLTRRHHRVPPPPKKWFRSLIDCFGEALKIRIAFKDQQPVAAILTIRYKGTLLYKYGCSDARFNNLGGTHLLFWHSIREAKEQDLRVFDFGRSDISNSGLITFKDRWGGTRSDLIYSRFTVSSQSRDNYKPNQTDWERKVAQRLFAHVPTRTFALLGSLLYKHIG